MSDLDVFREADVDRAIFAPLTRWEAFMLLSKMQQMMLQSTDALVALALQDNSKLSDALSRFKETQSDLQEMLTIVANGMSSPENE